MLVDANDHMFRGQQHQQPLEAVLAHEAPGRVEISAALTVIPVRDEHQREAVRPPEIESAYPVQILAGLVDLIYWQGPSAGSHGSRTRQDQRTARAVPC